MSGEPEYKLVLAAVHQGLGVLAGYLCATRYSIVLAMVLLILPFALGRVLERLLDRECIGGAKGWMAYSLGAYLSAWILAWTYFINR
ncbi:hypothetical protein [Methanopyrus sp.]